MKYFQIQILTIKFILISQVKTLTHYEYNQCVEKNCKALQEKYESQIFEVRKFNTCFDRNQICQGLDKVDRNNQEMWRSSDQINCLQQCSYPNDSKEKIEYFDCQIECAQQTGDQTLLLILICCGIVFIGLCVLFFFLYSRKSQKIYIVDTNIKDQKETRLNQTINLNNNNNFRHQEHQNQKEIDKQKQQRQNYKSRDILSVDTSQNREKQEKQTLKGKQNQKSINKMKDNKQYASLSDQNVKIDDDNIIKITYENEQDQQQQYSNLQSDRVLNQPYQNFKTDRSEQDEQQEVHISETSINKHNMNQSQKSQKQQKKPHQQQQQKQQDDQQSQQQQINQIKVNQQPMEETNQIQIKNKRQEQRQEKQQQQQPYINEPLYDNKKNLQRNETDRSEELNKMEVMASFVDLQEEQMDLQAFNNKQIHTNPIIPIQMDDNLNNNTNNNQKIEENVMQTIKEEEMEENLPTKNNSKLLKSNIEEKIIAPQQNKQLPSQQIFDENENEEYRMAKVINLIKKKPAKK